MLAHSAWGIHDFIVADVSFALVDRHHSLVKFGGLRKMQVSHWVIEFW